MQQNNDDVYVATTATIKLAPTNQHILSSTLEESNRIKHSMLHNDIRWWLAVGEWGKRAEQLTLSLMSYLK